MRIAFRMTLVTFMFTALPSTLASCRTISPLPDMRTAEDHAHEFDSKCKDVKDESALALLAPKAIDKVEPAYAYVQSGSQAREARLLGAKIRIAPPAGATRESIARALECHEAQVTLGRAPATTDDPTVLPGYWLDASVESSGDGFIVTLTTEDLTQAREVLARAQRFGAGNTAVSSH